MPHHCSLSLLAPQRLWLAQLSQGTAPRAPGAGGKPGTALPASAPGRSAARSPSRLQGRLLSLGEAGMDKAGLFPGEGATLKLRITNLPHCSARPAGAIDGGCFGLPGGFCPLSQLPTILLHVLFLWRCPWPGEGQQQGRQTHFPGHGSKLSCDCRSAYKCNQSFTKTLHLHARSNTDTGLMCPKKRDRKGFHLWY